MDLVLEASVDRLEGDVAVLLIGDQAFDLPLAALPDGLAEGDRVLVHTSLGRIELDAEATEAARRALGARRTRLLASDDGDDIIL